MRPLPALACALILTSLPVSAQTDSKTEVKAKTSATGEVTLNAFCAWKPWTFDPQLENHASHLLYQAQVFEAPLEMDIDLDNRMVIKPAITELPEVSKDGLTIKLRVRSGITFHDDPCFPGGKGRAVTAQDIVYSLMRVADPSVKSKYWDALLSGRIKGLDAWREGAIKDSLSDYDLKLPDLYAKNDMVVIKLAAPYPVLVSLLTQPWASVLPREAVQRYGSGFGETHPIGTGAFMYEGRDGLGTVILRKNPNYRIPGRPYVDRLRFHIAKDVETRTRRFLNGDLHFIDIVDANESTFLTKKGKLKNSIRREGIQLIKGTAVEVSYIYMNFRNKFLANRDVRTAIALAINRKAFIRKLMTVPTEMADGPFPPFFPESSAVHGLGPWKYANASRREAKRLLAKAGYPDGKGLPEFILDQPEAQESERQHSAAKNLKEQLAAVGIRVQIRREAWDKFFKRLHSGDSQMGWVRWYADYPDVENFLVLFRSHETPMVNSNYAGFKNKRYDELYDAMKDLYPSPERATIVKEMVALLRKEVPWVWLYYPRALMAAHKSVRGLRRNVLNFSLRDVRFVNDK